MKIIDAHVHLVQCIAGTGADGELRPNGRGQGIYANGKVCQLIPPEWKTEQVSPELVLKLMNEHQVEKAVLLQGGYLGYQNLYSYEAQKRYPDRFLTGAAYDPYSRNRDSIINHLFCELGIKVVKFEVSTGSGLMANHPIFELDGPMMEREVSFADEQGLIFVIDIGKLGSASSQIPALRRIICKHPGMKFVVCHLLAPKHDELETMCKGLETLKLPNVWFDTASIQHNVQPDPAPFAVTQQFVRCAIDVVGTDKILFGTDLPTNLCELSYQAMIDSIMNDSKLTERQKQMIMYENAQNVFWS